MLRVQPNDARSWVLRFRHDGKPDAVKADQARAAALTFVTREKGGGKPVPLPTSGPTLTKFTAEYVERRSSSWKPSTVKAPQSYLNSAMLPALGHLRVGSVVRADIARFLNEYGRIHDLCQNISLRALVAGEEFPIAPGDSSRPTRPPDPHLTIASRWAICGSDSRTYRDLKKCPLRRSITASLDLAMSRFGALPAIHLTRVLHCSIAQLMRDA